MDTLIVTASILALCVSLIIEALMFRIISSEQAPLWVLRIFLIMLSILMITGIVWVDRDGVTFMVGAGGLYGLLTLVYVFCIFGPIEASITLRLFSAIAAGKTGGVSKRGIGSEYNKKRIVDYRLKRFQAMGEIVFRDGMYMRRNRVTSFLLREYFWRFVQWFFKRNEAEEKGEPRQSMQ